MAMADRIAVMNLGRIEQVGEPAEIYRRPRSRFVADFIGESNFFEVELEPGGAGIAVLSDGTKVGCPQQGLPSGTTHATLMIRPESIQLLTPAEAPPGSLRATTVQTSFLGSYTRVAVRCGAAEDPVLVALHGKGEIAVESLEIDKEVALWWRPDDAVLIERAGVAGDLEEGTAE